MKQLFKNPKTTVTAIIGLLAQIVAYYGLEVTPDVQGALGVVTLFFIGLFSADARTEAEQTPHSFIASSSEIGLLLALPIMLQKIAAWLRRKDATGRKWQTVAANLLLGFIPAIGAIVGSDESGFKKALRAIRVTIDGYLGE